MSFVVGMGDAVLAVTMPEKYREMMDGPFLEDNHFEGVPTGEEPGLYMALVDFWVTGDQYECDLHFHIANYAPIAYPRNISFSHANTRRLFAGKEATK